MQVEYILTLQMLFGIHSSFMKRAYANRELSKCNSMMDLRAICSRAGIALSDDSLTNAHTRACGILDESKNLGIVVLSIFDDAYPALLKSIKNPPLLLHVRGNISALNKKSVAVVGARDMSAQGSRAAYDIGETLADLDIVVVSGLALGIDTQAHLGCVRGDGTTIAVLACGLDAITPASNAAFAQEIVNAGGSLVSEYPIQTTPTKNLFIQRDRIISGICSGVVVVECEFSSGTMHTAQYCIEQSRSLACVAFGENIELSGNKYLLSRGDTFRISADSNRLHHDVSVFIKRL